MIRVLVWNENRHEQTSEHIAGLYPEGIHGAIARGLRADPELQVSPATQDEPEHGLSEARLAETDVLVYWCHIAQRDFSDEIVARVQQRIRDGMGAIFLHSACIGKVFTGLMGTTGQIKWREAGETSRVWVVAPGHRIAAGLPEFFEIEHEEMYGEHFDIPPPEELVFISWWPGGEVVRSGCCFTRGQGKIFYFQPGHETYPVYHDAQVLRVIANAVHWAAPTDPPGVTRGNVQPLERLS
jgi:trehalose utilization protein